VIDLGCAEQIPDGENYVQCRKSKGTEGYSLKTDSYSLGVVLSYLLSKAPTLSSLNPNLSVYLNSIVTETMRDDQFTRPTARDMLQHLINPLNIIQ